jgi:ParB family chromosome partitioning protein
MTDTTQVPVVTGSMIEVPLNCLKKSPRNARRMPHGEAAIGALAASIAAKGVLQAPVVEPELDEAGAATGFYLVTIGEGRRLALTLLAKRKAIRKAEPVRCLVDTANDPHEISLDENVTRTDMHPADQFEAFRRLADERGLGAEEIGARFGVSAHVVRQRLRLGAVAPSLMALYREGGLTLDQLMAFAVSEHHARQEQVFELLGAGRAAHTIRRTMTETKVAADDRRAVFVGAQAYGEAGGTILRDLFTEDGGGWLEDVALLDRLTGEKLAALAEEVRAREGWMWALGQLDYPHGHGLRRVYPQVVPRAPEVQQEVDALGEEYETLCAQWDTAEDLPQEVEARLAEIDARLAGFGDTHAFDPADIARGGVYVVLGQDGEARIERGLIRSEDEAPEPEARSSAGTETGEAVGTGQAASGEPDEPDGLGPLSERLVLDLTAYRTVGLRDALAGDPRLALVAVVHAMALRTFYAPYDYPGCLDIKPVSAWLEGHAPGVGESAAGRRIAERHEAWATRLPGESAEAWAFVAALDGGALLDLLAHCASLTVSALRSPMDRRPHAWAHADTLAREAGLDMTRTWTVTGPSYLSRITKARILEAVGEGVSADAAGRINGLKKGDMVEAAQLALAGTGWLPPLLRTDVAEAAETAETAPVAMAAMAAE